eukprot:99228_1
MAADTVFNSSFFFENATYDEMEDYVFNPRKKQSRNDFETFLIANLKELEFKKLKKRKNTKIYQYKFEKDEKQKIKVISEEDGVRIIALYENDENNDISQQFVDRDKGEIFRQLMDRIMDGLEIVECEMFNLKCEIKLHSNKTIRKSVRLKAEKRKQMVCDTDSETEEVTIIKKEKKKRKRKTSEKKK